LTVNGAYVGISTKFNIEHKGAIKEIGGSTYANGGATDKNALHDHELQEDPTG